MNNQINSNLSIVQSTKLLMRALPLVNHTIQRLFLYLKELIFMFLFYFFGFIGFASPVVLYVINFKEKSIKNRALLNIIFNY